VELRGQQIWAPNPRDHRADAGGPTVPVDHQAQQEGTHHPLARHRTGPEERRRGPHVLRGHRHYTYQWRTDVAERGNPNRGSAGTYFYHCHVNTPLHVQMGMFGPIVVDPRPNPAMPAPAGTRRHSFEGPLYDIATETLIAPYSIDPRWHELNHAAGLNGEDAGLNRFEPRHFFLLGGNIPTRPRGDDVVWTVSQMRANIARNGKYPTLIRMFNVDYFPTLTPSRMRRAGQPGSPSWSPTTAGPSGPPLARRARRCSPRSPTSRS
jgi:hypothetical protein